MDILSTKFDVLYLRLRFHFTSIEKIIAELFEPRAAIPLLQVSEVVAKTFLRMFRENAIPAQQDNL